MRLHPLQGYPNMHGRSQRLVGHVQDAQALSECMYDCLETGREWSLMLFIE